MRIILITGDTYPHRRALRTVGAAWSRAHAGWIISAEAEPSVRAIVEPAGLTMELREESDGVLAPMSYADRRAAKSERHERRAERLEARANSRERKRGEAQAALNANPMYSDFGIMTEPIKVGHHSEGRHRRAKERVAAKMHKVVGLWREEVELRGRAAAAADAARPDAERGPGFMQRRIDEISAELRKVERLLAGEDQSQVVAAIMDGREVQAPDPQSEWGQKLAARRDFLVEGLAYWNALLDGIGGVQHSKATVKKGDIVVKRSGIRAVVERVNAKTVSVLYQDIGGGNWRSKMPYAEIVEVIGATA